VFAGKKSAQIREILISESAWEEMTCLFAPSLGIDKCTGDKLLQLSLPELVRLAERPELITVLRLRDHHQIDVLLSQSTGMG